jgi:rare lipoprotein A
VSYTAALKLGFLGKGSHQVWSNGCCRPISMPSGRPRGAEAGAADAIGGGHFHRYAGGNGEVVQPVVSSQMVAVDATVAAPAPAALESGFYLQLGAYSRADNAKRGARGAIRPWVPWAWCRQAICSVCMAARFPAVPMRHGRRQFAGIDRDQAHRHPAVGA